MTKMGGHLFVLNTDNGIIISFIVFISDCAYKECLFCLLC